MMAGVKVELSLLSSRDTAVPGVEPVAGGAVVVVVDEVVDEVEVVVDEVVVVDAVVGGVVGGAVVGGAVVALVGGGANVLVMVKVAVPAAVPVGKVALVSSVHCADPVAWQRKATDVAPPDPGSLTTQLVKVVASTVWLPGPLNTKPPEITPAGWQSSATW
jgi:hypothetical protein